MIWTILDMMQSGKLCVSICLLFLWLIPDPSSAKYPLATISHLLEVLLPGLGLGYDIACSFSTTLMNSSLRMKAHNLWLCLVVPAFHGHAHDHLCQLSFHILMSSGFRLEDLETCERVFAGSNAVARLTRHATPFHRWQFIDPFFHQWDAEKYENLGTVSICIFLHSLLMHATGQFLLKNYQQALEILHDMPVCIDTLTSGCNVPDAQFTKWLEDEHKYLNSK